MKLDESKDSNDSPLQRCEMAEHRQLHASRLVVLVEVLIWSSRTDAICERLQATLRTDALAGVYKSPSELGVNRLLIIVASHLAM